MATVTDVEVANASFPNVRQDLNDILEALASNFSNDTEPTTMYPSQFWYENDTNLLYLRNEDNDAWITLAFFDQTNDEWEVRTGVVQAANGDGLAFKTDEGTTRVSIADDGSVTINTSLDVDNIKIDGNTISSTDTNGDINITPNGTGKVVLDGLNYPTADGTDGQVLTTDGSGNIAFEDVGGGLFESFAIIADEKGASADGGSFSSGAWRVRDLNTEIADPDGIVSISSNQFTLGAGNYLIVWSAPAYKVDNHQTRLKNKTDGTEPGYGSTEYTEDSFNVQNRSMGSARVSIAGTKSFEIQHRARLDKGGNGFGVGNEGNWTENSIFTIVEIYKEA